MLLGEAMCQLIEEPQYAVEPLYAAAYRGDEHAIQQLARLGADPNIPHMESGYSALHVAVFRYKLSAVTELLRCFRGQLRLDLQDLKGDTALHMAARSGYLDICSAICDEHSCDPLAHPNNRGQFPSEICRSHKIYQVIQVCQKRNELARELEQLRMM
ncbi:hypothetical protein B484DRAFT_162585 [Ochromonadaceae sp. CCMP2298]|nr:hypothetical protein B484DRAFT_162585 [Ochromonadaceae sp. CCMP2298]